MTDRPVESRDQTLKELFVQAMELSAERRSNFIDEQCAGDSALRDAVMGLISSHGEAGQFFGRPTVESSAEGSAVGQPPAADLPAQRQIGPYKLLQIIGEGGFGTVYMAEQEHPVRRRVALKVIKLGMDTKQVVARFEAERQALAIMDHPNIARVFEAGSTDQGRPFFVMELVRGEPITRYCDLYRLTLEQRLELFIPVCQAVQHAHQKGIIHRDIKPNNILVTMHDGVAVPKVIDFGIAKATQQRLTEKTVFTEYKHMIGTPEYMAPEQAEMSGLDVDTRADVYSLGVVLYELLTGVTPFDVRELRSKAFAEMQRVICEVDPPRPSTRVSGQHTLPSIAAQRSIEPGQLRSLVRGELDWIVMKCLEKDRRRRYDSPSALAADVGRYLNDDVVEAHPPGISYRIAKIARRHRIALGVSTVVLAAILIGLIVSLALLARARRAERLAQSRLEDVSREAAKASAVNEFLSGMLSAANPFQAETSGDPTIREVLERAAHDVDDGGLSQQPEIRAAVRVVIGRSLQALGRTKESIRQLQAAVEERRKIVGAKTDDAELATSLNLLGSVLADQNQLDEAERVTRESMEMRLRMLGEANTLVADTIHNLATIELDRGDNDRAIELFRRALEIDRNMPDSVSSVVIQLGGLAVALKRIGKLDEAERDYREAMALQDKTFGPDHAGRVSLLGDLAMLMLDTGRVAEAESLQREALRVADKSLPSGHPDQSLALNGLARTLCDQGKFDEAEALARRVVELERTSRGEDHPRVAMALKHLAQILHSAGRRDESYKTYLEALQLSRKALGEEHPLTAEIYVELGSVQYEEGDNTAAEASLGRALTIMRNGHNDNPALTASAESQYAAVLHALHREDEADVLFKKSLDALRKVAPTEEILRTTMFNYWVLLADQGRLDEAGTLAGELLKVTTERTGPDSMQALLAGTRLAYVLSKRGESLDQAERLQRRALDAPQTLHFPAGAVIESQRGLLGEILLRQGKIDQAAPLIRNAFDVIDQSPAAVPRVKRDARERMAMLLDRQGKPDEAARVRAATTEPTSAPAN